MAEIERWHAREVEDIADKLIAEVEAHHPLRGIPIRYVFRDQHSRRRGVALFGSATKVSGLHAALVELVGASEGKRITAPEFFVVEVAHNLWVAIQDHQREALVDHLLSHFRVEHPESGDKERTIKVVGYDVEAFTGVVRRRGAWLDGLAQLVKAASLAEIPGQIAIPDDVSELLEPAESEPPQD